MGDDSAHKQPLTVVQFVVAVVALAVVALVGYMIVSDRRDDARAARTRQEAFAAALRAEQATTTTVRPEVEITSCVGTLGDGAKMIGRVTNINTYVVDFYISVEWDHVPTSFVVAEVRPGETKPWAVGYPTRGLRSETCRVMNVRRTGA